MVYLCSMQLSVWEKESFFAPKDVIILGSGLSGLWSTYYLLKKAPSLSVAIIDRGLIPAGASTRNAGFACFGSVTELLHDIKEMGQDNLLALVEMRYRGLERIRQLFGRGDIGFELCGGYELLSDNNVNEYSHIGEKMEFLNSLLASFTGHKKLFRFAAGKVGVFGFSGVSQIIENELEGVLHPGRLCQALLRQVQSMGAIVLNGIEVSSFEKEGSRFHLLNRQQVPLKAQRLLVCTNAFARELLPNLDVIPARGQILLTAPIEGLRFRGAFHYDEGFYYFRHLGNRILLGGARNKAFEQETTVQMETTDIIQQELERFLGHHLIPGIPYTITDRWSGIMGMGRDKMPIIKEVKEDVFCALRMSGMGVALTPIAGDQAANMILGLRSYES